MNYYSAAKQLEKQQSQKRNLANMYHNLFKNGEVNAVKVELDNNDTVTK